MTILEICAGGIEDCINAQAAGANRIELNSALHLGGLSPSLAVLTQAVKKNRYSYYLYGSTKRSRFLL